MIAYFAVTFAIFFVLGLIAFLIYASPGAKKKTTVPGPPPSDKETGNLTDIEQAGGLHNYLCQLHEAYGSVVGFYFGQKYTVSLASPDLLRATSRMFDRPPELFQMFEPLIGAESIQFANGVEGRARRNQYDRAFSHEAVSRMVPALEACGAELCDKLQEMAKHKQHVPVMRFAIGLSVKAVMRAVLEPDVSSLSDEMVAKVHRWYELLWLEMETRLNGSSVAIDNSRQRTFDKAIANMRGFVDEIIATRRKMQFKSDNDKLLIDLMIDLHKDGTDVNEERANEILRCDVITYFIGAFHTSGTLLGWAIYHLILNPEAADELRDELESVIGNGELNLASIGQLKLMRNFLNECMRISCLAPMSARVLDTDSEFGGYKLTAGTPLLLAHSVVFNCPSVFDNPEQFQLHRNFDQIDPFGFGRRKCPGYRLAYAEVALWVAMILRKFNLQLADSEYRAVQQFGLVTRPAEEIWILAHER